MPSTLPQVCSVPCVAFSLKERINTGSFGQPGEGGSQSQASLGFQGGVPCRAYWGLQGRYEDEIDAEQANGLRTAALALCPCDGL